MIKFDGKIVQFGFGAVGKSFYEKVAKEINIRFCSIDIILDNEDILYLMEANSGVMMDNFMNIHENGVNIAKYIYGSAINKMFAK